ncbi:MAG: cytochrome c biogenesis protein [Bryobacter sp.]|jgi:ABC-type uncharacterized transport system permease subunit|nr:cytochrome c biogenesis protein [Bryobacter sp.]
MQELAIFWLRVAVGLYSLGLAHALLLITRKESVLWKAAMSTFSVGVVVHLVSLVDLTFAHGHFPADNFFESVSLCGFLIAVAFLFAWWRYEFSSLAVIVFPLVFLMTLLGAMGAPVSTFGSPRVRGAWLLVHVLLILSGYASLLMAAAASMFYLIQEQNLKRKRQSRLFRNLPPLATLDWLLTFALGLGFALVTFGVIVGSTWAFIETGTRWILDPKIGISLITWVLYLTMVFLRTNAGWRGRKAALMSICLLGLSALTWAAHVGLKSRFLP